MGALAEAQIVGESALYAEARMAEMLEALPKAYNKGLACKEERKASLPRNLDHKTSHHAQLARHREAEAKERGEIPTRRKA